MTPVQLVKPVGREAAARKYDILTALSVMALSQDKHRQRQVLRLIALITARYNWQTDTLSIGQAEIAHLWSVDLRTVKREMARLRAQGWLFERHPAARGRVAVHGIDMACVLADTRPAWPLVGTDFVGRMTGDETPQIFPAGKIVPFPQGVPQAVPQNVPQGFTLSTQSESSCWPRITAEFQRISPAVHAVWIAPLAAHAEEDGHLILSAPSRFHADYVATHLREALSALLRRFDPALRDLRIVARS